MKVANILQSWSLQTSKLNVFSSRTLWTESWRRFYEWAAGCKPYFTKSNATQRIGSLCHVVELFYTKTQKWQKIREFNDQFRGKFSVVVNHIIPCSSKSCCKCWWTGRSSCSRLFCNSSEEASDWRHFLVV